MGGSWDYYCACCGSTFDGGVISEQPRTARFLRARRLFEANRQIEKLAGEGAPIPEELQREFDENREESGEDEDDQSSMDKLLEDYSYDPDVITKEESKWTLDLQCLGFNSKLASLSKAFLSGFGTFEDYGGLNVDAGDDPNYPDDAFFSAYTDFSSGEGYVYPFHPKCLDIFRLLLAHKSGSGETPVSVDGSWVPQSFDLDKDTLFAVLDERSGAYRLEIDYGDPEPPHEQLWESRPGEELLIADPTCDDELVRGLILDAWHNVDNHVPLTGNATTFVQTEDHNDPFAKLPFELLLNVISELESSSFMSLLNASPHVYRALDGNNSLWLSQIRKSMPWFFELHDILDNLPDSSNDSYGTTNPKADTLRDKSLRGFFVWAYRITTPRVGKTGPFMGVANRCRIWGVCQQLVDPYLARLQSPATL